MSENKVLLPLLTDDLNIIQALSNRPNQTEPDDLSPDEFKAKFDKAANLIKEYINKSLVPNISAGNVPFASSSGNISGETVLDALEQLKADMIELVAGNLSGSLVGINSLTSDAKALLESGIPQIKNHAPTTHDIQVGQIWLHTVDGTASGALKGLYIQISNDPVLWQQYTFDILPVIRGGTGKTSYGEGNLLYGSDNSIAELASPANDHVYLAHENGAPVWKNTADIGDLIERIKTAHGSYDGNANPREIEFKDEAGQTIEPKVLFIVNDTLKLTNMPAEKFNDHIHILTQGQKIERVLTPGVSEDSYSYVKECLKLEGDKLVVYHESKNVKTARCANFSGDKYLWTALY